MIVRVDDRLVDDCLLTLEVGNVHVLPLSFLLHLLHEPVVVDVPGGDLETGKSRHP